MSPKEKFLKTPMAKQWADMSASPVFERAVEVALLQFLDNSPPTNDQLAAFGLRADGAKQFARILSNLATQPEPAPAQQPGQLRQLK